MDELISRLREKEEITVLFLCSGNIVRSPMAEMLLELELSKRYKKTRIKSISGATTYFNDRIMEFTKDLLMKEGVSSDRIYKFRPRNVKQHPKLLDADLIIGMEPTHIRLIPKEYRSKAFILSELAIGERRDIPDPWGDAIGAYIEVFEVIKELIKELINRFEEWGLVP